MLEVSALAPILVMVIFVAGKYPLLASFELVSINSADRVTECYA